MSTEKVLDILHQLGFRPELVDENIGYRFEYEGLTILFSPEEDSQTLNLMVPAIFDITEDNRAAVLEGMVKLSGKMKFVQPATYGTSVWLNYQHYLEDQDPTPGLLEHMIKVMSVSAAQFLNIMNDEDNDE